jgi:hypothetical protein
MTSKENKAQTATVTPRIAMKRLRVIFFWDLRSGSRTYERSMIRTMPMMRMVGLKISRPGEVIVHHPHTIRFNEYNCSSTPVTGL